MRTFFKRCKNVVDAITGNGRVAAPRKHRARCLRELSLLKPPQSRGIGWCVQTSVWLSFPLQCLFSFLSQSVLTYFMFCNAMIWLHSVQHFPFTEISTISVSQFQFLLLLSSKSVANNWIICHQQFNMKLLNCATVVLLLLLLLLEVTVGFNLEPRIPVVKNGRSGSYFGYSVAQHQSTFSLSGTDTFSNWFVSYS